MDDNSLPADEAEPSEESRDPEPVHPSALPEPAAATEEPSPPEATAAEAGKQEHAAAPAKGARRRPKDPAVARAFRAGLPVGGKVERVIKGGYEVRIGKVRGFCPHSQMDLHRVENPEELVGQSYSFRITQMRRGGEDVVVSRRAFLEEERVDEAKAVRATLLVGSVTQGRVSRLAEFGAFVDLGAGVTGLVHISELSHNRVAKVADAVQAGDRVSVKVLKLDEGTGRISLSIRQVDEDPWANVSQRFVAGQAYPGKVCRLADFGAFVELAPGLEALAPAREFPPLPGGWKEGLEEGCELSWLVLSVEPERRRMSVAPAPEGSASAAGLHLEPGIKVKGKVQKVERFGVFIWLGPGQVGLVPNVWTGVPRGGDIEKAFPVGKDVEVEVVGVDDEGRRIRLSMGEEASKRPVPDARRFPGAPRERERDRDGSRAKRADDARPQRREGEAAPASTATFGTNLGDALKSALGRRDTQE